MLLKFGPREKTGCFFSGGTETKQPDNKTVYRSGDGGSVQIQLLVVVNSHSDCRSNQHLTQTRKGCGVQFCYYKQITHLILYPKIRTFTGSDEYQKSLTLTLQVLYLQRIAGAGTWFMYFSFERLSNPQHFRKTLCFTPLHWCCSYPNRCTSLFIAVFITYTTIYHQDKTSYQIHCS